GPVAAEGRDDVAAAGLDGGDAGAVAGGGDRLGGVAVPVGGARAGRVGLQERQRQVLVARLRGRGGQVGAGVVDLVVGGGDPVGQRPGRLPAARGGAGGRG